MTSVVEAHFTPNATPEPSEDAPFSILPHPDVLVLDSTLTQAGPSTWQIPGWIHGEYVFHGVNKKAKRSRNLTVEENEINGEASARFASRLALDHISVLYPDVDSPFVDSVDVVQRLLPYHVFQHPWEDVRTLVRGRIDKGKGKATDRDLHEEIKETKFALECFKRRKVLQDRFRRVKIKTGKRIPPDNQAFFLAQTILDADRAEVASLSTELRNARLTLERIQREKLMTSRSPYYSSAAPPAPYYRSYQYAYAQPYGSSMQPGALSSAVGNTSPLLTSTNDVPVPTGAIPVQLPVGSLPALHALGILPVPAASLPPSDQPQPPAVLRGSTANGTMLNLEINVSLLQQAQMGGLAMMLNSLMSRGVSADTIASTVPASPAP